MKLSIIIILVSILTTGCKKKYEEGFNIGLQDGIAQGQTDGYNEGYADGNASGKATGFETGFNDGYANGHADGYSEGSDYFQTAGYSEGHADGFDIGYVNGDLAGYNDGYDTGYNSQYGIGVAAGKPLGQADGYDDGYDDGLYNGDIDGYNDGYDDGYDDEYGDGYNSGEYSAWISGAGYTSGYNAGYSDGDYDGYGDGYDYGYGDGYDDGWDDGYYYGSSSKISNPQAKLIATINEDLFDYARMQKFDSKQVVASMGLSHADNGTMDMEKLASLKEVHYLNQMATQLHTRFGLTIDRALQVAKVAHQFNKLSGTRELTDKDANVFAKEVIGRNLVDVEKAVKQSMKGDSKLLNEVLNDISIKNGTSSENINSLISSVFF